MAATNEQLRPPRHTGNSSDTIARAFTFADLRKYSFKDRCVIRAADLFLFFLIKLIGSTARYEVEGWEHFESAASAGQIPIHVLWHDGILLAIYFWKRRAIAYMASQSLDGEYISRFLQRFGYGAVRGSTTRGGVGAMVEMARLLRAGIHVGLTIDGPKGPAHVAKMGAVTLAKKSGQPILPYVVTASRRWLAPSWDRLQVPPPFVRARVEIATPIHVPADADDEMLHQKFRQLQEAMDGLTRRGEEWRKRL
jgi:lysophospholipid acyltransferase (LPLAT)-like uncharacterized protein